MDIELYNEIMWVMKNYGSDAGERAEPGSKLKSQAERICEFVRQREEGYERLRSFQLVTVVSANHHLYEKQKT